MKNLFLLIVMLCLWNLNSNCLAPQKTKNISKDTCAEMNAVELYEKSKDYYYGTDSVFINKEKAYEMIIKSAEKGYAPAQLVIYELEIGGKKNAGDWLRKAAEQKFAPAMNTFSRCLYECDEDYGIKKDEEASHYWARLSAESGDAEGLYLYGVHFLQGIGTKKNPEKGIELLQQSAELGEEISIRTLCDIYREGYSGIPIDYKKHEYWTRKGAESGIAQLQFNLGRFLDDGTYGIEENPEEALKWYLRAGEQGYIPAYYYIGLLYWFGEPYITQNKNETERWFRKGSDENDAACSYGLAELYMYGEYSNNYNITEIRKLYERAAIQGNETAQAMDGLFAAYYDEKSEEKRRKIERMLELAEQGQTRAVAIEGSCYYYGAFVKKNKRKGIELIRQAALRNDLLGLKLAKENKIKIK